MATIADPTIITAFGTVFPKQYFIFVISKQEQHNHSLHTILGKLHIRNILIGVTDKKLLIKVVTVACGVNNSKATYKRGQTCQRTKFC